MALITPKQKLVQLILPPLHDAQKKFVLDPHRFVVASCGTKTGKTFGLSIWMIMQAWNNPGSLNWWSAPTFRQSKIAWSLIGSLLPKGRFNPNKSELTYELLKGNGDIHSRIEFKSADNPESLRGEGVHNVVVDEAAYWGYDSFVSVMTTLTRTRGKMRCISTPKGRNWFYEIWSRGWTEDSREEWPEYMSYQLPTASNPFVPRQSIEEAKASLPHDVFQQEYEARFLDESAGVFRNITACQKSRLREHPTPGRFYVLGIDWAKKEDWSVLTVVDYDSKQVVHLERWNEVDWNVQIDRAIKLAKKWNNALVIMDSTGVGDVPFDSMKAVYPHVEGYTMGNNAQKTQLIQSLQFALEKSEIEIPAVKQDTLADSKIAKILDNELRTYSYVLNNNGKFIYSAPEGYHDDTVIALSLANYKLQQEKPVYRFKNVRV